MHVKTKNQNREQNPKTKQQKPRTKSKNQEPKTKAENDWTTKAVGSLALLDIVKLPTGV